MGTQTKTDNRRKRFSVDVKPYLLDCLANTCMDFAQLQFDLAAAEVSPDRMQHSVTAEDKPRLEKLRDAYIVRIERILADLRRLK